VCARTKIKKDGISFTGKPPLTLLHSQACHTPCAGGAQKGSTHSSVAWALALGWPFLAAMTALRPLSMLAMPEARAGRRRLARLPRLPRLPTEAGAAFEMS